MPELLLYVISAVAVGAALAGAGLFAIFSPRARAKQETHAPPPRTDYSHIELITKELRATLASEGEHQRKALKQLEERMENVNQTMNTSLSNNARNTAQSLGELGQRLKAIDKAQENITKLSGDVLSLQDILSNKQARGAFGEIQLRDIVEKALPPNSYEFQAQLSNNKRPDCIIHMPNPIGPIAIDSKFPLEAYESLTRADSEAERNTAKSQMRQTVSRHIDDIAKKYIIEGETADGALLFLPSEAVYAELHANFAPIVRGGFSKRVWIVSPTTCMATLNTMRAIMKDAELKAQAGKIRAELDALYKDVDRLETRVETLDTQFGRAQKTLEEVKISAGKAGRRAQRLDSFDFRDDAELTLPPSPPSSE